MDVIAGFPKLSKLRLAQTTVDAAGLEKLATLKNLTELDLSECSQIFDDAMPSLSKLTSLKKLNLWRLQLTDEGVKSLKPLTSMQWLNLDNTQLSNQGLPALSDMTELTFLHLGSTSITNDGLKHLEGLKNLKDLKVTRTAVTQEFVDELKKSLPNTEIQLEYIAGE